jgi:putative phage-type endonuclease
MKIHKQFEQCSPEWFECRTGKMTASNATAIGNNGKGLDTYINNLMAEKYSSSPKEHYTNEDIERGNELEAQARAIYELQEGVEVEEVGFIELDEYTGCSPDGLVGEDGGIEIKCLKDEKYFKVLLEGIDTIVSSYIWQIQMCLYVSGRKWWTLIIYNPNFKKSMITKTIYPDDKYIDKLKEGLEAGKEKIKLINNKIEKIYG